MDMKKRVTAELKNRKPAEIVEMIVDNCPSTDGEVEGLTDEYTDLQLLSMVNAGLNSLAKLPKLPKLRKLELSDNTITGGLDTLVEKCPNLTYLNLGGNKVKELSAVKPLQNLRNLRSLDLYSCEVSTLEDYRDSVFELLPQIVFLDGYDQEDNEAPESEEDNGPHGGHDDDEDDDEDDEEEGSEEEEEEEVGLSYLLKDGIQDEEDDDDYVEEDEDEEEEDGVDEEDHGAAVQGEKRKRDAEDEGDDDEDDE